MPPQETTALLDGKPHEAVGGDVDDAGAPRRPPPLSLLPWQDSFQAAASDDPAAVPEFWSFASAKNLFVRRRRRARCLALLGATVVLALALWAAVAGLRRLLHTPTPFAGGNRAGCGGNHSGPYRLVERQVGRQLFEYYDFLDGPDSLGSAGFNVYVGAERAFDQGLASVETDEEQGGIEYVVLRSQPGVAVEDSNNRQTASPTLPPLRESVRLEGKRRVDRGLFLLDVTHMPSGCGAWPAFWLTDEDDWPEHGEIDVVEGVNRQSVAKTALHTSEGCSMYAHVPPYAHSGYWDSATGIPNTWTGLPDVNTTVPADNCWVLAPHQWANQGCVAISAEEGTIGAPLNARGGGVYALEWDPANRRIRSWVFPADAGYPDDLQHALWSAHDSSVSAEDAVRPDPDAWGLPYAYFAIGDTTGCSADHFQNHRLIFNLAFCGTVAGNRFLSDCPDVAQEYLVVDSNGNVDPIATCNAYVASDPPELRDAYWKVRGVYVYERE